MDIYALLKRDGALMEFLLQCLERCEPDDLAERRELLAALETCLREHEEAEERSIFPLLVSDESTREDALRAREDNRDAEALVDELRLLEPSGAIFRRKVAELSGLVRGHFTREEERLLPGAARLVAADEAERLGLRVEHARGRRR